jgi:hypothetical protein
MLHSKLLFILVTNVVSILTDRFDSWLQNRAKRTVMQNAVRDMTDEEWETFASKFNYRFVDHLDSVKPPLARESNPRVAP